MCRLSMPARTNALNLAVRCVLLLVVLLSSLPAVGCGPSPTTPTPIPPQPVPPTPTPPPPVPPPPPATTTETWNVTMRLTDAPGDACLKEAVDFLLEASMGYTVSLTHDGHSGSVSLESHSHNYDCRFDRVAVEDSGFTSEGIAGQYSCNPSYVMEDFRCSNERHVSLFTFGQDISGRISGDDISGTWKMSWFDRLNGESALEATAQYTGRRQE